MVAFPIRPAAKVPMDSECEKPVCPLCAASAARCYSAGDQRMYRCEKCRVAFVHPLPTDEFLKHFYAQFHRTLEEGGGYEIAEARMRLDFEAKLNLLRRLLPAGKSRVLDVGCGKGHFLQVCSAAGIDAEGIDLSSTAAEAANAAGLRARCSRVEDLETSVYKYDAVTFWATIEHVPNPISTLRGIRGLLKPGGLLLLDTGIGDDWLDRLLPGMTQWYDPPQHLYVFSVRSMQIALERSGFNVIDIDRCFERSLQRKAIRALRGFSAALGLRAVASIAQLRPGPFEFTRYPLGNLMSVAARAV
jgi:SAM-dependent methyltransferase